MEQTLKRIVVGQGREGDIDYLKKMGEHIKLASFCGLGQSAPNPVLSTIEFFKDEYLAHIKEKKCPALACKALISYVIDSDLCTGCVICAERCPTMAIIGEPGKIYRIDPTKCIKCGICLSVCPPKFKAVKKVTPAL
jgi:ferredoxin